jgi:hypothetical protein
MLVDAEGDMLIDEVKLILPLWDGDGEPLIDKLKLILALGERETLIDELKLILALRDGEGELLIDELKLILADGALLVDRVLDLEIGMLGVRLGVTDTPLAVQKISNIMRMLTIVSNCT